MIHIVQGEAVRGRYRRRTGAVVQMEFPQHPVYAVLQGGASDRSGPSGVPVCGRGIDRRDYRICVPRTLPDSSSFLKALQSLAAIYRNHHPHFLVLRDISLNGKCASTVLLDHSYRLISIRFRTRIIHCDGNPAPSQSQAGSPPDPCTSTRNEGHFVF